MKKGLFLMAALILISGASMAQKVVTVDGKAIIDNRDMPAKAIAESKKPRNVADGIATAENNKTVSHYFEVMKTDLNNGTTLNWLTAIQSCANYDSGDGKKEWRLPTQRELQLIWTLHESLKKKTADFVSFYANRCWSATESNASVSWCVNFSNGNSNISNKTSTNRVRCVRDLTPPAK